MIHYALQCDGGHSFDGWFRSSDGFAEEKRLGRLVCPICESKHVDLALMAPAVAAKEASRGVKRSSKNAISENSAKSQARQVSAPALEQEARAFLRSLQARVERECEYVGDRFAEEARKRHKAREESQEESGNRVGESAGADTSDAGNPAEESLLDGTDERPIYGRQAQKRDAPLKKMTFPFSLSPGRAKMTRKA